MQRESARRVMAEKELEAAKVGLHNRHMGEQHMMQKRHREEVEGLLNSYTEYELGKRASVSGVAEQDLRAASDYKRQMHQNELSSYNNTLMEIERLGIEGANPVSVAQVQQWVRRVQNNDSRGIPPGVLKVIRAAVKQRSQETELNVGVDTGVRSKINELNTTWISLRDTLYDASVLHKDTHEEGRADFTKDMELDAGVNILVAFVKGDADEMYRGPPNGVKLFDRMNCTLAKLLGMIRMNNPRYALLEDPVRAVLVAIDQFLEGR
jgi:hypothetical protein